MPQTIGKQVLVAIKPIMRQGMQDPQPPLAPYILQAPTISGTPASGQNLTCSTGNWSDAPTYAYQWLRSGVAIAGATTNTYAVVAADIGNNLSCQVTATNAAGASPPVLSNSVHVAALSVLEAGAEGNNKTGRRRG
jgi:hypothetical protein